MSTAVAVAKCYACGQAGSHASTCPRRLPCGYPPGCESPAMPGWRLCQSHYDAVYALFGPA